MATKTDDLKFDIYDNAWGNKVIHFKNEGVHLTLTPHTYGMIDGGLSGIEIYLWPDKDGKPDTAKILNSITVDGTVEDMEEIADTYARRLVLGIKPENIFDDIIEANREAMRELSEKFKTS